MHEKIVIRPGKEEDKPHLISWLQEEGVLQWFPMYNLFEIEDAARIWVSYARVGALLTAEYEGEPAGIANLYLQPYQKLKHQALLAIIVTEKLRNKGIGTKLLEGLIKLAKETFSLEILHLEVYENNPAKRLYERCGFEEYGYQKRFIKDEGKYLGKHFMQKKI